MAKYFFSIREQDKDGFKTVQFFVFSLRTDNKYEVAFGNNTFVVVEHRQRIVRSTDNGSSFDTASEPGSGNNYYGVGFGNNTFVAVGSSGNIIRSTDNGSSFVNVTSPTEIQLRGVAF